MLVLSNAFSLNMLPSDGYKRCRLDILPLSMENARGILATNSHRSAVGHPQTAEILTGLFGFPVPCSRETVKLDERDRLLVAQYRGPRLPEGATMLPEGAEIRFYLVSFS